jgi:hypothetical protein
LWEPTSSAFCTEGRIEPLQTVWRARSHRGLRAGHVHTGVPQERGRSRRLRSIKSGRGHRRIGPLAHGARARRRAERKQARGRYRQTKATKYGETGDGKSEHRIVLLKQGNPARGRPCGRKAMPNHGTGEGQHVECTDIRARVNETTADSAACEAKSADEFHIQGFFDALDHAYLRDFLKRRVRDGVLMSFSIPSAAKP